MKSLLIKSMILFVLLVTASVFTQAETKKTAPTITADETFWDFGFVPFDYELVHFYEIKNTGTSNLYITHLGTSCDCTAARAMDTLIPPGGSTKIKATFSTEDYYGKTTRSIGIDTNDPDNPRFMLEFVSLIGALPKHVAAEPNALFFLSPHKDKDVKLLNKSGSKIDVLITLEPDSIFTISAVEFEIDSGGSSTIKITPRTDLNAGTYHTSFLVEFGTKPPVKVTVPIKIVRY